MTSDYFQRVQWFHDACEDPVVLWAHVVDGSEVRKVDEFANGRLAWADSDHESGSTRLSAVPVPTVEAIAKDPQFVAELVGEAVFEEVWSRARARS